MGFSVCTCALPVQQHQLYYKSGHKNKAVEIEEKGRKGAYK